MVQPLFTNFQQPQDPKEASTNGSGTSSGTCFNTTQRKKRCEWTREETVSLCQVWPKYYAKLKMASTKAKNQVWMNIFSEFINTTKSEKELNQIKTKTRSLEKEFKEIKLRMSRTGEEGADKIKEKMKDTFDLIDTYLSERDSIDPNKMNIISSGIDSIEYYR